MWNPLGKWLSKLADKELSLEAGKGCSSPERPVRNAVLVREGTG
jgi:hypothetical protein